VKAPPSKSLKPVNEAPRNACESIVSDTNVKTVSKGLIVMTFP
jgi:hypothetical protein